ncbi:MAG: DinB family protein, partial [Actinomycetota bacterium]
MTEFAWTDELNDVAIRDELDRRHPERIKMRGTDVAGLQQAFSVVEEIWAPTIGRARRLPPPILHERVNGEYSLIETIRHLLFAWDAWLPHMVLRGPDGYHDWAVPPDLPADAGNGVMWSIAAGWSSSDAAPDLDLPVLDVRTERLARVRDYLSDATAEDLKSVVSPPPWYAQREVSALLCFRVVLHEEWWHHQYAT